MPSDKAIVIKNLKKSFFGVKVLKGISLDVNAGEVHVLVGENGAGKSTLAKIITGSYSPDEGEMWIYNHHGFPKNPFDAVKLGISMVQQDLNLIPDLNVAANIFLGNEIKSSLNMLNLNAMETKTSNILKQLGFSLNSKKKIQDLSPTDKQMVQIAKALFFESRIIILDEPTAALTSQEFEHLKSIIADLKEKGVSFIYISHRLEEIKEIGDRVTVMRDGNTVLTSKVSDISVKEIVKGMIGRDMSNFFPERKKYTTGGSPALEIKGLVRKGSSIPVSMYVNKKEVVGIYGLVGSGRSELLRAIYGLDPVTEGEVVVNGLKMTSLNPRQSIRQGMVLVPEERKYQGLFLEHQVFRNSSIATLKRLSTHNIINVKQEKAEVGLLAKKLKFRPLNIDMPVGKMSGGNQQKVLMSRWLMTDPMIFLLDEPTRGVDVGAKVEMYNLINELIEGDAAVLVVSSDLPEILGICDRIYVMRAGEIITEFKKEEASQEAILSSIYEAN